MPCIHHEGHEDNEEKLPFNIDELHGKKVIILRAVTGAEFIAC